MHSVTIWFLIHENISACCWAECKAWVLQPLLCRCPSAAQRQQLKDGGWWGCVWPLPWQWINAVCVEQSRSCCSGAGAHTCSMLPPAALWGLHHMHSMHHQPSLGKPKQGSCPVLLFITCRARRSCLWELNAKEELLRWLSWESESCNWC